MAKATKAGGAGSTSGTRKSARRSGKAAGRPTPARGGVAAGKRLPRQSANGTTGPHGELSLRAMAMPADTNPNGDIFGGWLLSQMDVAGGIFSYKIAKRRVVTVAVDAMTFRKPVYIGDLVSFYAQLIRIGTTSITVRIEAWVMRRVDNDAILVTEGNFTYVAIDDRGRSVRIKKD